MAAENRKASRVRLGDDLRVEIASIGSDIVYHLTTRDISINGFFMSFDNPGRFPFTEASIMEVRLFLPGEAEPVFFNGKMSRIVEGQEASESFGPGIAVRIIQIDSEPEKRIAAFIHSEASKQFEDQPQAS